MRLPIGRNVKNSDGREDERETAKRKKESDDDGRRWERQRVPRH